MYFKLILLLYLYSLYGLRYVSGVAPSFDASTYAISIDENMPSGTTLNTTYTVTASEAITFSLSGSDAGSFVISTNSVLTTASFDYETKTSYTVTLTVTDASSNTATATLTIAVVNLNDNAPVCPNSTIFSTLPENTASGTSIAVQTCTDADGDSVSYSIISGDDVANKFQFASSSSFAMTTTSTPLNYEVKTYYGPLVVHAVDAGSTHTTVVNMYVEVTPVNEFTPVWSSSTTAYSIAEQSALGTTIVTLAATDGDSGSDGVISFTILSATANDASSGTGIFSLDATSGLLVNAQIPQRDSVDGGKQYYDVVVNAMDGGGLSINKTLRITVTNINDETPIFSAKSYLATVIENSATTTSVIQLAATDADPTSTLAYSIVSGNSLAKFAFSSSTPGLLETTSSTIEPDAATSNPVYYELVIMCKDGGSPELNGTASVYISVNLTNDFTPSFGSTVPSGSISVAENTAAAYTVATVSASDNDYGEDGTLSYSIVSGDSDGNFILNSATGVIQISKPIDFETLSVNPIPLVIYCADQSSTSLKNSSLQLPVTVTNVNDNSPICSPMSHVVSLSEIAVSGTLVTTLSCTDADVSDTLTYTLLSGNTGNAFTINNTGSIISASAVNYDSSTASYLLMVRVSDSTHTLDIPVQIGLSAVNEVVPTFSQSPKTITLAEDQTVGAVIDTFLAVDIDYSPHQILTYAIAAVVGGTATHFTIDSTSAQIRLALPLDFETSHDWNLTVTCTDGGGHVGYGTLLIVVTDVNDNTPSCSVTSQNVVVPENTAVFPYTIIAALGCSDADNGTNAALSYTVTQSPGTGMFSYSAGGALQLLSAVDFESVQFYTVNVKVMDTPGLFMNIPVTISVSAINEGPPVFSGNYTNTVSEGVAVGTLIRTLVATDPDGTVNSHGNPAYTIFSGNTNNAFLLNSKTGVLTTARLLDRETLDTYVLTIKAIEECGTNTAFTYVTISLSDVNDNPPTCNTMAFSNTILETVTGQSLIQNLSCSDPDSTSTLSYSIISGDTTKFSLTAGYFYLSSGQSVDFDAGTTSYSLTIRVTDSVNYIDIPASVNIGPVNEASPIFTNAGTYTVSIPESQATGTTVITVVANDADSSATADGEVSYSVVSGANSFLSLQTGNGKILLSKPLDRETTSSYTMVIGASDGTNSASASVTVTVTDVNDNPPVFNPTSYSASLLESVSSGTSVVQVIATDSDDPNVTNNGIVTFSILSGNTGTAFSINSSTGHISTAASLDYETLTSYTLVVAAKDKGGASGFLSASASVVVSITDVNEATPTFGSNTYTPSKLESLAVGGVIQTVAATDADTAEILTYSMSSSPTFYLNPTSGTIYLKAPMDYETTTSYSFNVTCTDNGSPAKSSIAIVDLSVLDVNDNTPTCTAAVVVVSKREDIVVGTQITALSCSDADSGVNSQLVYSISTVNSNPSATPFSINSTQGTLTLGSSFNYEAAALYDIAVLVSDSGSSALSTTIKIEVNIQDVNEFSPSFTGVATSINIVETSVVGASILTCAASDQDTSDVLSYAFLYPDTVFVINPSTGAIKLISPLDRETNNSYTLHIVATDSNPVDGVRNATHSLTIIVTDDNDNFPVFSPHNYFFNVSEHATVNTLVNSVSATDLDSSNAGTITYGITSGNTGNVFRIQKNVVSGVGEICIDSVTSFSYEILPQFDLVVTATDGGGQATTSTVIIDLLPYNDYTPTFIPTSSYSVSLPENTTIGTVITSSVNATDSDAGLDGAVRYLLTSGDSTKFSVDSYTGAVTLLGELDRETSISHVLQIKASDLGTDPGVLFATATLTVTSLDVNDVTPVCTPAAISEQILETVSNGSTVTIVNCTDGDLDPSGVNNALTFSITSGNTGSSFAISTSTGTITTSATLSHHTTPVFTLTIGVSDQGHPSLSTSIPVVINVLDTNQNTPIFTALIYNVTIAENSTISSQVLRVNATDADSGINGEIVYSITSGNAAGNYAIDSNTGWLTSVRELDRETTPTYSLVIQALDLGIPALSSTCVVNIDLSDVNDNTPALNDGLVLTTVQENSPVGTHVITLTSTDADLGVNAVLQWSITAGNTGSTFQIESTNGSVSVASNTALDREVHASFSLSVQISDSPIASVDAKINTMILQITLLDSNDNYPIFINTVSSGVYTSTISEGSLVGHLVVDCNATDADEGQNSKLTYSIIDGDTANQFYIDSADGSLYVRTSLDRETQDFYSLNISATDNDVVVGNRLTSYANVRINLTDVNDNNPACPSFPYTVNVMENATTPQILTTVSCTDADLLVNAALSFNLTSVDPASWSLFNLDPITGDLSLVSSLDYETTRVFTIVVGVTDNGTSPLSSTLGVIVNVIAINEYAPAFVYPPGASAYSANVSENVALTAVVLSVNTTDLDYNGLGYHAVIRYILLAAGNEQGRFDVDEVTGELKVIGALDREITTNYSLTVQASDSLASANDQRFTIASITILVLDVNDNPPTFQTSVYAVSVVENEALNTVVLPFVVTDLDTGNNGAYTLTLLPNGHTGQFNMTSNDLVVSGVLNHENQTRFELTIMATDHGSPALNSNATVVVNIQSINEYYPVLSTNSTNITIPEDIPVGTVIYDANATDLDTGVYGQIVYAIASGNPNDSHFIVDEFSGILSVASVLDFDASGPSSYTLNLSSFDNQGHSPGVLVDSLNVYIQLTDVNDNYPVFSAPIYSATIAEDISPNMYILTANASDIDSSYNALLTYSIDSGDGAQEFLVNSTNGEISTGNILSIDYEFKKDYLLILKVIDAGNTSKFSFSKVQIYISDVNDNTPTFVPRDFSVSTPENGVYNVTTVMCTDADSTVNSLLSFTIESATNALGHFSIVKLSSTTAVISSTQNLDRESIEWYNLTITATDAGSPARSSSMWVSVRVSDLNDNAPIIWGSYSASMQENSTLASPAFAINATDLDKDLNSLLTFSITNGAYSAFSIDSSSGVIKTISILDRETRSSYVLSILVVDNGFPQLNATTTVSITILDNNDNFPIFTLATFTFNVDENVANETLVGTVTASDADIGMNSVLVFSLNSVLIGQNGLFRVASGGGVYTTGPYGVDREQYDRHMLRVSAKDSGATQLESLVDVVINIGDRNDVNPSCQVYSYTPKVVENRPIGTSVVNITAADSDINNNAWLSFSISGNSSTTNAFSIGQTNGEMTLRQPLDREHFSSYGFYVVVLDAGSPSLSGRCWINVSVIDENDNSPQFDMAQYSTEISYDETMYDTPVITALATDSDYGLNGSVVYTLIDLTSTFVINSQNGEITRLVTSTLTLNYKYVLEVTAHDNGIPSRSTTVFARVDTFDASAVSVSLKTSLTESEFASLKDSFLSQLKLSLIARYPSVSCHLWKTTQRLVTVSINTNGRKKRSLLASTQDVMYITALVYAMQNNDTSITQGKSYLTVQELLTYWQSTSIASAPSTLLSASNFEVFKITGVDNYVKPVVKRWYQTSSAILLLSIAGVATAVLVIAAVSLIFYYCWYLPDKSGDMEMEQANEDEGEIRAEQHEPIQHMTYPKRFQLSPKYKENQIKRRSISEIRKSPRSKVHPESVEPSESSSLSLPSRNVTPTDVRPEFDGKAFDPVSGRMYEYNTRTGDRRWITNTQASTSNAPPPSYISHL